MISTERRMLRYNFTPDEHLANCAEMARLYDAASEMEANHKSIKAKLKEDEENTTAQIGRACRFVRDQHDFREIECKWEYNVPGEGQKSCIRLDTGITVEVRAMQEWEKQETLKFEEDKQEGLPLETVEVEVPALNGGASGVVNMPVSEGPGLTHAEKLAQRRQESEAKKALRAEAK